MGLFSVFRRGTEPPPEPVRTRGGFEGAARGRRNSGWTTFGRTNVETLAAAPVLRAQARRFAVNNPERSASLVTGLVGAGIVSAAAHEDADARARIQAAFDTWAKRADADRRTDLFGLQAAAVRALVVDGEAFLVASGMGWRLLPAEMVDEADTHELSGGGYVVAGIEFDATGRRTAYMIRPDRPTDVFQTARPSLRVPAEDVVHLMQGLGAGQVRGTSWLAPILLRLGELDSLEDALAVGVKVAALHAGFLIDQNGTAADSPFDGVQNGSVLESGLEPGTLRYLPSGWDVSSRRLNRRSRPPSASVTRSGRLPRASASPAHLVSGDLRDANYGSLRAGMVAYRQRLEQVQFGCLIPQMVAPMFERAVNMLALSGDIGTGRPEAEHYPPPMPWIDPAKDVAALRDAIDAGLMSRRQAVAQGGYSIEALDAEIAADQERARRLGLSFGASRASQTGDPRGDA